MNEMRKLIETVQPLFENQNLGRLEEKLLDLTMEYAQTLSTIKDYYDDPSDDPHSMFSSQIEQFTEELQSLLNRLGFFQDSEDLAEVDQMETDGFEVGDLVRIVGNSWDSLEDELEEYQSRKYQGKVGRVKFPKARKGRRRGVSVAFGWNSILANPEDLELVKKADDKAGRMSEMRESDPSVRRSLRGRPLTDFEVEYHLTLNVTVEAEDQEDAREVFFEEFEREQMHLHEGELTIYDAHGPEARARFRKSTKEQ